MARWQHTPKLLYHSITSGHVGENLMKGSWVHKDWEREPLFRHPPALVWISFMESRQHRESVFKKRLFLNPGILFSVHFFLGCDTLNDNKIIEHSACLYFTGVSVLLVEGKHFISFGQNPKSNSWGFSVLRHSNLHLITWNRGLHFSLALFNSDKVLSA